MSNRKTFRTLVAPLTSEVSKTRPTVYGTTRRLDVGDAPTLPPLTDVLLLGDTADALLLGTTTDKLLIGI